MLPGVTCVKGFLRTYASFLRLDADGLVESYRSSFEPRVEEPAVIRAEVTNQRRGRTSAERKKKRVRRHQRGYALAAVLAIIVIALLAWFGTSRGKEAASIGAENISTSTISTVSTLVSGGDTSSTGSTGGGATSSSDTTGGTGSTLSTEAVATSSTTSTEAVTGTTTATGQVSLVIQVTEGTCWLVVREDSEDGAEIYAGTLSAGGKQTFESAKRYWMMVGKPESLDVKVGGKPYTVEEPAGSFVVTAAGIERSE